MPEIIRYTVTETTSVTVIAKDEEEALQKANVRFINPTPDGNGYPVRRIKTVVERSESR